MTGRLLFSIIGVAIMTMVCGCTTTPGDYSGFVALDSDGWAYGDTVELIPTALDSVAPMKVTVSLRHNDRFPYRNLWLEVSYKERMQDSIRLRRDTVNIEMADTYGRWLGHGIGTSYQCSADVNCGVNIVAGSTVKIRHVMRVDTLRGIEQIGIAIQK